MSLLGEKNYDEAFMTALGTAILECVIFACNAVVASDVIGGLSQTVLLCLLQQLGMSLKLNTFKSDCELELEWIQGVSMRIDCEDKAVSKHLDSVKGQVVKCLDKLSKEGTMVEDKTRIEVIKRMVKGI